MTQFKKAHRIYPNTVSRDMIKMSEDTGNVYETVMVIAKRADQISQDMKTELDERLREFASVAVEDFAEISNNAEQIEVSRYYERLPKSTLIAAQEYTEGELYHNIPGQQERK